VDGVPGVPPDCGAGRLPPGTAAAEPAGRWTVGWLAADARAIASITA